MPEDADTTHILLVGHVRPYTIADLEVSLPDCRFHRYRVLPEAAPKRRGDRVLGFFGVDARELSSEEYATQRLSRHLRDHPDIKYALAIGKNAQRILQSTLQSRTDVIGFGNVEALKRCVQRSVVIDLSVSANHLVDPSYSYEAISKAAPLSPRPGRAQLLVGPNNEDALAMSLARAVATSGYGIAAVSLSIGDNGFPADLMLSERDWESREVRRDVRAAVRSATHVLVTPGSAFPTRRRTRKRYLGGFDSDSVSEPDYTVDPNAASEGMPWLPVVVPTGLLTERSRVADGPPRTLIISPEKLAFGTARRLAEVGRARLGEFVDIRDIDPIIRLQTAANCGFVLDLRERPRADAAVLAGLAGGAVLMSDFSDWHGPVAAPPHIPRGSDPIASLVVALKSTETDRRLRMDSKSYVRLHHDGRRTAAVLAAFLRVRQP